MINRQRIVYEQFLNPPGYSAQFEGSGWRDPSGFGASEYEAKVMLTAQITRMDDSGDLETALGVLATEYDLIRDAVVCARTEAHKLMESAQSHKQLEKRGIVATAQHWRTAAGVLRDFADNMPQ